LGVAKVVLVYILWHWPFPEVHTELYEGSLSDFHRSLVASKPQGFKQSCVFHSRGAPWAGASDRGYEDWYLLDGSTALDKLNDAAISQVSKGPHDIVAHAAAGAVGGLYQLKKGEPAMTGCRFAYWLVKPRGTGYEEFYTLLEPWTELAGVSLWRRQMVLGPTPEFGLFSPQNLMLPSNLQALAVQLELVWP
jgi:hypothetical protein